MFSRLTLAGLEKRTRARPSRLRDAFAFARTLLEQPTATLIEPGERLRLIFERLCSERAARGNLVQDAWFAAPAIESGCEWVALDRDHARFHELRWRLPW